MREGYNLALPHGARPDQTAGSVVAVSTNPALARIALLHALVEAFEHRLARDEIHYLAARRVDDVLREPADMDVDAVRVRCLPGRV